MRVRAVGPALLLIFVVVLWPTFEMLRTSVLDISISGISRGLAGLTNYQNLFVNPELPNIMLRTLAWVGIVVVLTIVISLVLAALLNAAFPGRRIVRWALIVPWAASVVMTATIWRWMLDTFYVMTLVFTAAFAAGTIAFGRLAARDIGHHLQAQRILRQMDDEEE